MVSETIFDGSLDGRNIYDDRGNEKEKTGKRLFLCNDVGSFRRAGRLSPRRMSSWIVTSGQWFSRRAGILDSGSIPEETAGLFFRE